jgi:hypothetical protein
MNKQQWINPLNRLVATTGRVSIGLTVVLSLMGGVAQAAGPNATAPNLGTAASFAVLGSQTVTNTGASVATGHLGVSPGTAITGFPPGIVIGEIHSADAIALQAQSDVGVAYDDLAGQACNTELTGQDLGGLTLSPGVYCFASVAQLTGQLSLDAQGDPDAVWVFQIGSALNTSVESSVLMINGGNACNVFWQVGSSATLGVATSFAGTLAAFTSISIGNGTSLSGRALARNGAVTMHANAVSLPPCSGPTPTATATPPEPTVTPTGTIVATATNTPVATVTATLEPTVTPTGTIMATATNTPVATVTAIATQGVPTAIEMASLTVNSPAPLVPVVMTASLLALAGFVLLRRR